MLTLAWLTQSRSHIRTCFAKGTASAVPRETSLNPRLQPLRYGFVFCYAKQSLRR
jgi:hypothetical protein